MTTRFVETEYQRRLLAKLIDGQKLPFTATIAKGKKRSPLQNRLNRLWAGEIAEQLEDETAEYYRGLMKLQFGVPLLRAENEAFNEAYTRHIEPLPYETRLALMQEPLDWPVTRLMRTDQQKRYLDNVYRHFAEQGVILTIPIDKRFGPSVGVSPGETEKNSERI